MKRKLHKRLTAPPGPGESPEGVLEVMLRKIWDLQITKQQVWLDARIYETPEDRVMVRQLHAMLSAQALECLSLLLNDYKRLEQEIKATSAPCGRRGLCRMRFAYYLKTRFGITLNKAHEIMRELENFYEAIMQCSTPETPDVHVVNMAAIKRTKAKP